MATPQRSPHAGPHPEFALLTTSWELSLRADGYADNSVRSYLLAVRSLAGWLTNQRAAVSPAELTRDHVRGWLAWVRQTRSPATARSWYGGVRHLCAWLVDEGEAARNPTDGIRTPVAPPPATPILAPDDIKALLATCTGQDFTSRRDTAIIMVLADGGLRLAEVAGLTVTDVDVANRVLYVAGKASRRSGPRHRAVPLGLKAGRALDRYLRARRTHPYAAITAALWLGHAGRPTLSADGVERMLQRRATVAGVAGLHPHMFRHTWAHQFRAAGGSEGDLMTLGGWRSRAMLDRYGATAAAGRAAEAYRRLSLGDRL